MRVFIPLTPQDFHPGQPLQVKYAYSANTRWLSFLGLEPQDLEIGEEEALYAAALQGYLLGGALRLCAVAEVANETVKTDANLEPGQVALLSPINWDQIISLHVDTPDMLELAKTARSSQEALEELQAESLSWFDVSEAPLVQALIADFQN